MLFSSPQLQDSLLESLYSSLEIWSADSNFKAIENSEPLSRCLRFGEIYRQDTYSFSECRLISNSKRNRAYFHLIAQVSKLCKYDIQHIDIYWKDYCKLELCIQFYWLFSILLGHLIYHIASKLHRILGCWVTEAPVQFQKNWRTVNTISDDSRRCMFLRSVALFDSEIATKLSRATIYDTIFVGHFGDHTNTFQLNSRHDEFFVRKWIRK